MNNLVAEVLVTNSPGASIVGTVSTFPEPFPPTVPPVLNPCAIELNAFNSGFTSPPLENPAPGTGNPIGFEGP